MHQHSQTLEKYGRSDHGEKVDTGHGRSRHFRRHEFFDMGIHQNTGSVEKAETKKQQAECKERHVHRHYGHENDGQDDADRTGDDDSIGDPVELGQEEK